MPGRPHMKPLVRLALFSVALACAVSRAGEEPPPGLYSFADLYRLTVSAPPATALAFAAPQTHPAREPQVSAAPRFTVTPASGPGRWALLLAGLAAAGWVAHRRLALPYWPAGAPP